MKPAIYKKSLALALLLFLLVLLVFGGIVGKGVLASRQKASGASSEKKLWFWCYTDETDGPLLYAVTPGNLPERQPLPPSMQQGKFGVEMYLWEGKLYWTVREEEETVFYRLYCYDLETGVEQMLADSREQTWDGSVFLPVTTDGTELFLASKVQTANPEHYRYLKYDASKEKLLETELYGCYQDNQKWFYDRDKNLLQKSGSYYYYSSFVWIKEGATGEETLEPSIACYDTESGREYQYLISEVPLARQEKGKREETEQQNQPYTLFLRDNYFYMDYQDEKGNWHGYRLVFQGSQYKIEKDETHPGGAWERVAVLKKKQLFAKTGEEEAPYFLEYDWETGETKQIALPERYSDSPQRVMWVVQEQEDGYTLCLREGVGGLVAVEGFRERERCLVRWYQQEEALWYERIIGGEGMDFSSFPPH